MKKFLMVCVALLAATVYGSTNTISYTDLHNVKSVTFNFSNLNVVNHVPASPTNATFCTASSKIISGSLDRMAVLSSTATGATFRIILTDDTGSDMLGGLGSVVSTTAGTSMPVSWYSTNRPFIFESSITCTVTNFADAAQTNGVAVKFFYRE